MSSNLNAVWNALRNLLVAVLEIAGILGIGSDGDAPDPKRTARVIRLLLTSAIVVMAGFAAFALREKIGSLHFFVWALVIASCALMVGGALGVLFGLPNRKRVEVRNSGVGAPALPSAGVTTPATTLPDGNQPPAVQTAPPPVTASPQDYDSGYEENTSLEQIADWLTKIIIGLTLTQYGAWEARYFDLSRNVTQTLQISLDVCGTPQNPAGDALANGAGASRRAAGIQPEPAQREIDCYNSQAIPGGMLMAIFAIIGFLIGYFWMRRYFIFEMVTARREEAKKYEQERAQKRIHEDALAKTKAEADATVAKLKAESDAIVAKLQADAAEAAAKAAADAAELKARAAIAEAKPERTPEAGNNLIEILEKTMIAAPQIQPVQASIENILGQLRDKPVTYPDDPWRDRLGGSSIGQGYTMTADAAPTGDPNLFDLKLKVHSNNPGRDSGRSVWFFLHPTFGTDTRTAAFDAAGDAVLSFLSYGAFTTGALLEDGTTLELNLAEIDAPAEFRQR